MATLLELLGRSLASALGLFGGSPASVVALVGAAGVLGLVVLAATAAVRSVAALAASLRLRSVWSRAAVPVAGWLPESQSAPDADGRPRPRAPAVSLPVA